MVTFPCQLRYTLSRGQRLIPHLRIWGIGLTLLVVGLVSFFLIMTVVSICSLDLLSALGFGVLALVFGILFGRLLGGLIDVVFVPTSRMDVTLEENALGILLGKERWYLFLDGVTRIDRFHRAVWTLQHFNGYVLHIAASAISEEQLDHIRQRMEFGRTPQGIQVVIERGKRIKEIEEEGRGR